MVGRKSTKVFKMGKATLKCFEDESKVPLQQSPSACLFNFPKQFTPKSKLQTPRVKSRGPPSSSKGTPSKTYDSKNKSPSVPRSRFTRSLKSTPTKLTPKSNVEETPKRKRYESQDSWKDTPLTNSASKEKPRPRRDRSSALASGLATDRVSRNADACVKRWNDLQWNERYTGVFDSSVTALGDKVVQVFRRFSPWASAPPKKNRMKLVSGTVLEGSLWLRVSDDVMKPLFSYPKRSSAIQPYDGFCVPQGKHYSLEAGSEGTIVLFNNVTD